MTTIGREHRESTPPFNHMNANENNTGYGMFVVLPGPILWNGNLSLNIDLHYMPLLYIFMHPSLE